MFTAERRIYFACVFQMVLLAMCQMTLFTIWPELDLAGFISSKGRCCDRMWEKFPVVIQSFEGRTAKQHIFSFLAKHQNWTVCPMTQE